MVHRQKRALVMRTTRRRLLAGGATTAALGLAGCLDVITGKSAAKFEADAAVVAEAALDETGYEEHRRYENTVTRTFEAAGQSRDVKVTNRFAEYDRSVGVGGQQVRGAMFNAMSTPKVEVLGRSFNPVADMSTDDFAKMIEERYDNVRNLSREGSRTVTMLGTDAEVARYVGKATLVDGGADVNVVVHVTEPVASEDDFVVCVGVHPQLVDDTDAVNQLIEGLEHPVDG